MTAAQGCSVIVHAVNPPGYRRWAELVLPMLDNSIAAATTLGALSCCRARSTIWPRRFSRAYRGFPAAPSHPQGGDSCRDGAAAARGEHSGARVIIVRAGDFFGPQAGNNWFSQGLIKPGKSVTTLAILDARVWVISGPIYRTLRAPSWSFSTRRDSLESFARFHMAGHWDEDGSRMSESIRRVVASAPVERRGLALSLVARLAGIALCGDVS